MSEIRVLLLAALVFAGTAVGQSQVVSGVGFRISALTLGVVVVMLITGLLAAIPNIVLVSLFLVAVQRGEHAASEYQIVRSQTYDGQVVLITDPKPTRSGWRAEAATANGDRVLLSGVGIVADPLRSAGAGQRVEVSGALRPIEAGSWTRSRHLVGRLSASSLYVSGGVPWYQKPSEWLRDAVRRSASEFDDETKNLYLGLVIGDDRFQPVSQRARFRAVGLSHLLAVSGQNVAFVLAVAGPFLKRLGLGARFATTLVVLVVFALATRLEPSVLRATMTAAIAAGSVLVGRRSVGCRTLALAVTLLVLLDPMLVYSVGFALSVCASLGILVLGPSLQRRLVGPTVVRDALAVTISAQLGVAPILMVVFGPVSLASIPANLLAGFAAGAVMTLGLTVGLVASLMPSAIRTILQVPTHLLVWWIDVVADKTWPLPIPVLGPTGALLGAVSSGMVWWLRGKRELHLLLLRAVVVSALFYGAVISIPNEPSSGELVSGGGRWWISAQGDSTILVIAPNATTELVDELVANRVTKIDLVVMQGGSRQSSLLLTQIREVAELRSVVAPPDHRVVGARRLVGTKQIAVRDESVDEALGIRSILIESSASGLTVVTLK